MGCRLGLWEPNNVYSKNPKNSGLHPLCHAASNEARRASADYLAGDHERELPEGAFRPPITKVHTTSRL